MDRPGTCIILDKKYNIANSSCHFGSYGSIWTGPSPNKYYMNLRSFGLYNIFWVTDRSIYCQMTISAMNYLLYIWTFGHVYKNIVRIFLFQIWIETSEFTCYFIITKFVKIKIVYCKCSCYLALNKMSNIQFICMNFSVWILIDN